VIIIAARVAAVRIGGTVFVLGASMEMTRRNAANHREMDLEAVADKATAAAVAGFGVAGITFFPRGIADQQSVRALSLHHAARRFIKAGHLPSRAFVCAGDVAIVRGVEAALAASIGQVYPDCSVFSKTAIVTPFSILFRFVSTPMELFKNQCVTTDRSVREIFKGMVNDYRHKGIESVFKGAIFNSLTGFGFFPWWSTYLAMNTLFPNDGSRTLPEHLAVGVVPSVMTDIFMNPLRVLKVQAMTDRGLPLAAVWTFIKDHGPRCLLWGLGPRLFPGAFQSVLFALSMESLSKNK